MRRRASLSDFNLTAELGRGVHSVVYRGEARGHPIAVKVGKPVDESHRARQLHRFFYEAGLAARAKHPNLVGVLEVGVTPDGPYLVMPLVEGQSLAAALAGRRFEQAEAAQLGLEVAGALASLHALGAVHRDLSTENILLAGGSAYVIDFGLAAPAGERVNSTVGSATYSAPEQTGLVKLPIDGRADFYSLGVILYEAVAGRPPLVANDNGALLHKHVHEAPEPLTEQVDGVSRDFSQIVMRLLAKDPEERFSSVDDLRASLSRIAGRAAGPSGELQTQAQPMRGRAVELRSVEPLLEGLASGYGSALRVSGPAGIGKSRFIREAVNGCEPKCLVLTSDCATAQQSPLSAISPLLYELYQSLERLPHDHAEKLRALIAEALSRRPEIRRALPGVVALLGGMREPRDDLPPDDASLGVAVSSLLVEVAKTFRPIAIVIDNVNELDSVSAEVLRRLSREAATAPLMVCVASSLRSADVLDPQSTRHIELGPLSAESARELIVDYLRSEAIDSELFESLEARCVGNPLLLIGYLEAMIDHGALAPAWDGWRFDADELQGLKLPSDAEQLVLERLRSLSAELTEVLGGIACLGQAFDIHIAGALPFGSDRVRECVARATDANVLRWVGGSVYAFVHQVLPETLLAELPPGVARDCHRAAAKYLDDGSEPGTVEVDRLFRIARHYLRGWRHEDAKACVEAAYQAGRVAADLGLFQEGYEVLSEGLQVAEHTGLSGYRTDFMLVLSKVATQAGLDEAEQFIKAALRGVDDPEQQATLYRRWSWIHLSKGNTGEARQLVNAAFRAMKLPVPGKSVLSLARILMDWGLGTVVRSLRRWRTQRAEKRAEAATVYQLYQQLGWVGLMAMDPITTVQAWIRPLRFARALGPSRELVDVLCSYSGFLTIVKLPGTGRVLAEARSVAESIGDRTAQGQIRLFESFIASWLGQELRTEQKLWRWLEEDGDWANAWDYINGAGVLLWHLLMRGRTDKHVPLARTAIQRMSARGVEDAMLMAIISQQAVVDALRGHKVEAAERMQQCIDYHAANRQNPWHITDLQGKRIAYAIETGDIESVLDDAEARFEQLQIKAFSVAPHVRHYYSFRVLALIELALKEQRRTQFAARLRRLIAEMRPAAQTPLLRGYLRLARAAAELLAGRTEAAKKRLTQLFHTSLSVDAPNLTFYSARLLGHVFSSQDAPAAAHRWSGVADSVAIEQDWMPRRQRLASEFPWLQERRDVGGSPPGANESQDQSYFEALMEVSLATAEVFDADEYAERVLDETVRVMNAERGLMFLAQGDTMLLRWARSYAGEPLEGELSYSSTVVDRVAQQRSAIVVTGTEEGALLGSQSAVAAGLRSIIAAPLLIGEKVLGVIYLDSTLARGLFRDQDVDKLRALAGHIGISLERVRSNQLELERQTLAKDLEVSAAVQRLFVPVEDSIASGRVEVAGINRPASHCGGDWWSFEPQWTDSSAVLVLGDVTGHGAGAAMVTAAVAGVFRHLAAQTQTRPLGSEAVLHSLHHVLESVCNYGMTMLMAHVDVHTGAVDVVHAGTPPWMIAPPDAQIEVVTRPGTPLGVPPLNFNVWRGTLAPGTRLIFITDGILESKNQQGKAFGLRRFRNSFESALCQSDVVAVRDDLLARFDAFVGDCVPDDDITLVVMEYK